MAFPSLNLSNQQTIQGTIFEGAIKSGVSNVLFRRQKITESGIRGQYTYLGFAGLRPGRLGASGLPVTGNSGDSIPNSIFSFAISQTATRLPVQDGKQPIAGY